MDKRATTRSQTAAARKTAVETTREHPASEEFKTRGKKLRKNPPENRNQMGATALRPATRLRRSVSMDNINPKYCDTIIQYIKIVSNGASSLYWPIGEANFTEPIITERKNENLTLNLQMANIEQEVKDLVTQLKNLSVTVERELTYLKSDKDSLQMQVTNLTRELTAKTMEAASLNNSVAQLVNSRVDAEFKAKKLLLDNHVKELSQLDEENIITIQLLNEKLMAGETERRKLHNTVQELKGNIRVFCRVRPLLKDEMESSGRNYYIPHIHFLDEKSLLLIKRDFSGVDSSSFGKSKTRGNYEFKFDRIFTPHETQAEVFEEISQLVQSALDGYNVCVFAYGQTRSGKTFTMEGVYKDFDREGIIPRSVSQIFQSIEKLNEKGWNYKVEASFLEIYNESIRDLLASLREVKNNTYDIKLSDRKTSEVFVSNLKIMPVNNVDTVHHLLNVAQQHRAVAATNLNARSSRSHSVFRLKLTGKNSKTGETSEGSVNLVDLACSERLKNSGSEGARLTEAQNINKSLANLSNVILALAQKKKHIPYRNSKLTHLLQGSLGGNSKTLMLVTVSPLNSQFAETINSLRFASKVNQYHIGNSIF